MNTTSPKKAPIKFIMSCTIGTFLEFFDYTLYGYFSAVIGKLFFPGTDLKLQLIATWGVFSIGFLVRPLGALLFGHIADKHGRCKVLPMTILLMSLPTVAIGLLPTFASIGWFAPGLLLLCRLIQGLALSAEYNAASIFALENNWKNPGFLASLSPFSGGLGMIAAALLAYTSSQVTGDLNAWLWRFTFIIAGSVVGLIGWYLRRTVEETQHFRQIQQENKLLKMPLIQVFKENKFPLITCIICSACMGSISYLLLVYLATFLHQQFHMTVKAALLITIMVATIESCCVLLFGWISDFVGQTKLLFFSSLSLVVASLYLMRPDLTVYQLMAGLIALAVFLGAYDGPLTIFLPMLFKTNNRYSATAFGYNIGAAAIGGFAPFIITLCFNLPYPPQFIFGFYVSITAIAAGLSILYYSWMTEHESWFDFSHGQIKGAANGKSSSNSNGELS